MADDGNGFAAFMSFMDKKADTGNGATSGKSDPASDTVSAAPVVKPDDEYYYEEEQEREAMMKSYHHPMKQWFRQNPHLVDTYGAYPLFWQDLKTWTPYREVLKKFLRETEDGASSNASTAGNNASTAAGDSTAAPTNTQESTSQESRDGQSSASAETAQDGKPGVDAASAANGNSAEEPPKRRKKSRGGDAVEEAPAADGNGEKRRKKSRWAPAAPVAASNLVSMLTQQQQQSMVLRARLEQINAKLQTVAADAARIEKDPNRPASPPPQYDANGKRTNTREVRMRAELEKQRQQTIDEMVKINPLFRPPADYQRSKLSRKIYIPVNDFPSYNFIGLIIGPRGNTQKRMEKESNCKIAIRGKGSVKEGSKGKKVNADENDDLHVLITGEREEDIERAAKEVQSLLVPVDDMKNEHKQKQLRELALINGTLRDDDFCHLCGEKGHRQWECPNREKNFKAVDVRCAICGDSSHPTRDCTQRGKSAAESAEIDKEYQSFMQQLGEKPIISTATKPVAAAPAPWLQPAKASSAPDSQPWMTKQSVGAPGTGDVPPPPGTHTAPALGSTPQTAFPPPVAPATAAYAAYPPHAQAWNQWGTGAAAGYYYGSWDQSTTATAAAGTEYQYAQYDPNAAAATQAAAAPGAEYAYQYPTYPQPPQ